MAPCHREVSRSTVGFCSCGIFYIGGKAQVRLHWSLDHLADLTTAVESTDLADITAVAEGIGLDIYKGQNAPGQHWRCYRSRAEDEEDTDKDLRARLTELLTPSTEQEYLDSIPKREGYSYCPYIRFAQKKMNKNDWLVDGEIHNGAHFPLCVFTRGARARSAVAQVRRAKRNREFYNARDAQRRSSSCSHANNDRSRGQKSHSIQSDSEYQTDTWAGAQWNVSTWVAHDAPDARNWWAANNAGADNVYLQGSQWSSRYPPLQICTAVYPQSVPQSVPQSRWK